MADLNLSGTVKSVQTLSGSLYAVPGETGGSTSGKDGGYYTPSVTQPDKNTMRVSYTPSDSSMPEVASMDVTLPTGADGKSAYQYAQDGGYTETESAFAAKLAQEQLTGTTNDLTPTQVYDAVSAGIPVKVQYIDSTYGLLSFTAFNVAESLSAIVSQTIVYYNSVYILAELNGDKTDNTWGFMATTLAQKTDIPSALPNPNALTFTGAVTGSYDGSAAVSVEIPSGGGAEKKVRHIATVSVTEGTTSYSVTVDSNGDALNLESVYILTEKFWGSNGSYVQVDVNGKVITKAFGQSGSPQVLELEKMGELQKFTNIPKPSDVGISFGDYYNGKSAVTSVGFWSATSNVNTTIEIYGVDA